MPVRRCGRVIQAGRPRSEPLSCTPGPPSRPEDDGRECRCGVGREQSRLLRRTAGWEAARSPCRRCRDHVSRRGVRHCHVRSGSRNARPTSPSVAHWPKGDPALTRLQPDEAAADAGMRIEPPPSLAWATAPSPTRLPPPRRRSSHRGWVMSHGLCVAPHATGSVVGTLPSSGLLVRPAITSPAARCRRSASCRSRQ